MRIAYGVFGYGRGHATRTAAVLPELTRRHELLLFAGGDAYEQLWSQYPVVKIPTLGYAYTTHARRSNWLTFRRNAWHVLDMLYGGPTFQLVLREMQDFRPDVVISDAEPWTHRAARRLRIPRIGFDHFGILVYCRLSMGWGDRLRAWRDAFVYRRLMGRPQRVIVSSFYDAAPRRAGVTCIGPLLRDEVLRVTPRRGGFLLAYFNKGEHQFTPHVEAALRTVGRPTLIYGVPRQGRDGPLDFRPASNRPFVEDLAGCHAVISTAGNQLVGEAVHLGKPMLVIPEDCVEQRCNAAALERLGLGAQVAHRHFSAEVVERFLAEQPRYCHRLQQLRRDGRAEALAVLERFFHELVPATAPLGCDEAARDGDPAATTASAAKRVS